MQRYFNQLVERMEKGGFPGNDPLYLEARDAQAAIQKLSMSMHYLRCAPGTVGHPRQGMASDSTEAAGAVD